MIFQIQIEPYGVATEDDLIAMYEQRMINAIRAMRGDFLLMPFRLLDVWWP